MIGKFRLICVYPSTGRTATHPFPPHIAAGLGVLSQPGDIRGCCVYSSVAEGAGRGAASGLQLEGRVCSTLILLLGGDLDVATRV